MTKAPPARQNSTSTRPAKRAAPAAPKKHKLVGVSGHARRSSSGRRSAAHLTQKLNHRQIDSVEELLNATPPDEPGVVLWDARECADQSDELARLQAHSASFAIIALDVAEGDVGAGSRPFDRGQIVAHVAVPIDAELISGALASAYEEASARVALLGEAAAASGAAVRGLAGGPRVPARRAERRSR